jgi:TPP-dependent pyruvate/acetoin dehydrogenase alpha subunit
MSDAGTYRSKEEVEFWKSRDPIPKLKEAIKNDFEIGDEEFEAIDRKVEEAVAKAVQVAEAGEELPPERLFEDLYVDGE